MPLWNGSQELRIGAANLPDTNVIGDANRRRGAARIEFDAPLTREQVIAIVRGFIRDDPSRGLTRTAGPGRWKRELRTGRRGAWREPGLPTRANGCTPHPNAGSHEHEAVP
ncbi:MAG TPA: hypothetical protein VK420_11855 [Longimicrobium sp.]|nr:hypothetical protein [Longimicrobium sp.]